MACYAGIGSRETPIFVGNLIENVIATSLAKQGYTLRSGGAKGADTFFEKGCDKFKGKKEIWLPWRGFENNSSHLIVGKEEAFKLAEFYHPNWKNLSQGARRLHSRNMHQILGEDLRSPSKFVVCYTEGGKGLGGTGQALRVARDYNIPIFDLGKYRDTEIMLNNFNLFMRNIN